MHSDLIVMTYEGEGEASRVYDALQRMRASPLMGLENAAVVTRDSRGGLAVTQTRGLTRAGVDTGDYSVSSAITLLFGDPPEEMVQAMVKEGYDDRFRENVLQTMGNNSSALLILMPRDSEADRGRLISVLTLFKGRVFETTLPLNVEAALAKGWEA